MSTVVTPKEAIAKLREATGLPFNKCREAAIKFPDNFDEAVAWLKVEGAKLGASARANAVSECGRCAELVSACCRAHGACARSAQVCRAR